MAKEKDSVIEKEDVKTTLNVGFAYSFVNGVSIRVPISSSSSDIKYDEVVDKSQFRPDSENVRLFRLSGQGSEGTPVYDENGVTPTDLEVQIRSGKFDKAEISQMQISKKNELNKEISENYKKDVQELTKKLDKARQEYLDKATGFKGSEQSETVK